MEDKTPKVTSKELMSPHDQTINELARMMSDPNWNELKESVYPTIELPEHMPVQVEATIIKPESQPDYNSVEASEQKRSLGSMAMEGVNSLLDANHKVTQQLHEQGQNLGEQLGMKYPTDDQSKELPVNTTE